MPKRNKKALLALAAAHGALPPPVKEAGNKYKVSKVEDRTWEGRVYASRLEMNFHKKLLEHFPPDKIHIQVPFQLQAGFRLSFDQELRRPIRYISDFVIGELPTDNQIPPGTVVIDSKGFRTPDFNILKKLFEYATQHPLWMLKSVKALTEVIPIFKNMQTINHSLIKTLTDGPFIVVGYSGSDGTVSHKKMRIIGREGYLALVRESIELLPQVAVRIVSEAIEGGFGKFTEQELAGVVEKLQESLENKLVDKEPPAGDSGQISPAIGYHENKLDHLIVLRLELMEETVVVAPAKKDKKPSASAFRAILEDSLPISRYVHRINLYPGKYQDVQPA